MICAVFKRRREEGKKTQFIWKVALEIFDEPVEKEKPPDLIKKI